METIFTKIINGDIPSYKIAENESCYAFLDISPLAQGHTLVIPKRQVDNIFDLADDEYQELFLFAKKIAKAIKISFPCIKVGVAVIGIEVPHAHIHLVPINKVSDLDFKKQKLSLTKDEFELITSKIINSLG
ncbi:MAG: HIT family protein [Bacteroidota bacterium]|jgi:histidine triad (HIT) family protein